MGIDSGYGIGSVKPGVCTSSTRPASPFTGQMIYETDTSNLLVWNGSSWTGVSKVKKVARFTASGSWTVPTGVTYAVAYIRGAGGGVGRAGGGDGGSSSVAFASGTITANGGTNAGYASYTNIGANPGATNSGQGAFNTHDVTAARAGDGAFIVGGADVTAGASITVTVGAGGTSGTSGAAGGSGYVWIEYEV